MYKEPYPGNPKADTTICYVKRRRHVARDIVRDATHYYCRHCRQNPFINAALGFINVPTVS